MSLQTLERPETIAKQSSECLMGLNYPLRGVGIEVGVHEIDNPELNEEIVDLDENVDIRWKGFIQGSIIVPHFIDEENQTKNIVRGSVPLPIMAHKILPDIMARARERFVERSNLKRITSFNSNNSLLTVREDTGKAELDDDVLAFFEDIDDAVAEIANRRYSQRLKAHPSVQEFFAYHELRSQPENRKRFRERVKAALLNPNSPNENAFTSDPNAPFFMKLTVNEDGVTTARNVANEDVTYNGEQAVAGLGHDILLDTDAEKNREKTKTIEIVLIGDVTSDAGGCSDDPEKGCAAFFRMKMKQIGKLLKGSGQSISLYKSEFLTRMALTYKLDDPAWAYAGEYKSKKCNHDEDEECDCAERENKDQKKSN